MDAGFEFQNLAGFKMFSMVDVDSMAAFFLGHLGHQRHGNIPRKLDHFKSGLPGLWRRSVIRAKSKDHSPVGNPIITRPGFNVNKKRTGKNPPCYSWENSRHFDWVMASSSQTVNVITRG